LSTKHVAANRWLGLHIFSGEVGNRLHNSALLVRRNTHMCKCRTLFINCVTVVERCRICAVCSNALSM